MFQFCSIGFFAQINFYHEFNIYSYKRFYTLYNAFLSYPMNIIIINNDTNVNVYVTLTISIIW